MFSFNYCASYSMHNIYLYLLGLLFILPNILKYLTYILISAIISINMEIYIYIYLWRSILCHLAVHHHPIEKYPRIFDLWGSAI